jgi:hypothetical protein
MKQKSVQALGVLGHFGKKGVRYWQRTLFRQAFTRNGEKPTTKNLVMKIAPGRATLTSAISKPVGARMGGSSNWLW